MQSKKIKITSMLLIIYVLLVIFLWERILIISTLKFGYLSNDEWVYLTPESINVHISKKVAGSAVEISKYNLCFKVPAASILEERKKDNSSLYYFYREDGDKALLRLIPEDNLYMIFINNLKSKENYLADMMISRSINNNFLFYDAVLNTTPKKISFLRSIKELKLDYKMLTLKHLLVDRDKSVMYKFNTNSANGFQMGNPSTDDVITAVVFDYNNSQYRINFMNF